MKKIPLILSGILLMITAYVIHSFTSAREPILDLDIIQLFSGICFGAGIGLLIAMFFGKKTQVQKN